MTVSENIGTDTVETATEQLKTALGGSIPSGEDVTLVVQPYLDVTATRLYNGRRSSVVDIRHYPDVQNRSHNS